jgi:hypothetical protein
MLMNSPWAFFPVNVLPNPLLDGLSGVLITLIIACGAALSSGVCGVSRRGGCRGGVGGLQMSAR